jgi:hypothetical protein
MNGSLVSLPMDARHAVRHYGDLNRLLDQQAVYTVNENQIAAFREMAGRLGPPHSACYWLLMARLAELALLCAGHYADCGEIGAAGDLLVNPRRIEIHVRGIDCPIVKDRHRRLSEQLNPGGLSLAAFSDWFRRNAISRIVEPALLPDFVDRLKGSGWLAETFLNVLQDRMSQVTDAMRFGAAGSAPQPTWQCRFNDATYRLLGRHIARTCREPAYRSVFLVASRREDPPTAPFPADKSFAPPAQAAV